MLDTFEEAPEETRLLPQQVREDHPRYIKQTAVVGAHHVL